MKVGRRDDIRCTQWDERNIDYSEEDAAGQEDHADMLVYR